MEPLSFTREDRLNLHTVSLEFSIDAKREELSILTDLPNPIASGLAVLHRPAIDPQEFSQPRVPDPAGSRGRVAALPRPT